MAICAVLEKLPVGLHVEFQTSFAVLLTCAAVPLWKTAAGSRCNAATDTTCELITRLHWRHKPQCQRVHCVGHSAVYFSNSVMIIVSRCSQPIMCCNQLPTALQSLRLHCCHTCCKCYQKEVLRQLLATQPPRTADMISDSSALMARNMLPEFWATCSAQHVLPGSRESSQLLCFTVLIGDWSHQLGGD